jgi:hypothetical protein
MFELRHIFAVYGHSLRNSVQESDQLKLIGMLHQQLTIVHHSITSWLCLVQPNLVSQELAQFTNDSHLLS